jgi:hypothetical protein
MTRLTTAFAVFAPLLSAPSFGAGQCNISAAQRALVKFLSDSPKNATPLGSMEYAITQADNLQDMWKHTEPLTSAQKLDKARDAMSGDLHNLWRSKFIRDNSYEAARLRQVPQKSFNWLESAEEAKRRLEKAGAAGLEIVDGKLMQNVNVAAQKLVPELRTQLYGKFAKQYLGVIDDAVKQGKKMSPHQLESMASDIHTIWIEANIGESGELVNKYGVASRFDLLNVAMDADDAKKAHELFTRFRPYEELSKSEKADAIWKLFEALEHYRDARYM